MVGHRVSQAELYDDRDVIIQILKLKDTVNDYAGGIIDSIDIVGDDLVIDWADGTNVSLPLPSPTGISSVTGTVSGGNLTVTIYMTDGSSHAFTTPLSGMATEAYVDAGLALKADDAAVVKLDGAQTIDGAKTFSVSPEIPSTPATPTSAVNDVYVNDATAGVNNLLHKSGDELSTGFKYGAFNKKRLNSGNYSGYTKVLKIQPLGTGNSLRLEIIQSNATVKYDILIGATAVKVDILSTSTGYVPSDVKLAVSTDGSWYLFVNRRDPYQNLVCTDITRLYIGDILNIENRVEFLDPTSAEGDPSSNPAYTDVRIGDAMYTYKNGVAY